MHFKVICNIILFTIIAIVCLHKKSTISNFKFHIFNSNFALKEKQFFECKTEKNKYDSLTKTQINKLVNL